MRWALLPVSRAFRVDGVERGIDRVGHLVRLGSPINDRIATNEARVANNQHCHGLDLLEDGSGDQSKVAQ